MYIFLTLEFSVIPYFKKSICLYGRWDGMFFITSLHENVSTCGTISTGTICKVRIISFRQSGMECLYDKNCPAFAGIPRYVERITAIPLHGGTGRKTSRRRDHRINTQPEVRLRVGAFDVGVLVFSAAAIFLASVHEKCLRYTEDVDVVFMKKTVCC